MYHSEETLATFNSYCTVVVYSVHKKIPSQIMLTVHPTISFRQQSYRSFRARLKKTNSDQSQENLPHPLSSGPLTLLETKLLAGRLCPKAPGRQLVTLSSSFCPGRTHSFGLLTGVQKRLMQTSKASSMKTRLSHFLWPRRLGMLHPAARAMSTQPLQHAMKLTVPGAHHSTSQASQAWGRTRTHAEQKSSCFS